MISTKEYYKSLRESKRVRRHYLTPEGTWPHSAAATERTMGYLDENQREKPLGGNASRFFGIEVPTDRC